MPVRNITVRVVGDALLLRRAMRNAEAEIESFKAAATRSASQVENGWSVASKVVTAGALAVALGLGASATAAAEFDQRMRNVNSISHLSESTFRDLSKQVVDLSRTLPQSANTLAEGLYDIASSGFQGADGLHVLEVSAKAASAGMTDTKTAAQAITAVLNAYNLSAASAGYVSDVLFQTVNYGVVTFEELTGAIGQTVGTAAAAHVPISEVGSAIAAITLNGITAAEAGTSLNQVISKLLKPSKALADVIHGLGFESGEAALQQLGLRGTLEAIGKAGGTTATALVTEFNDIRAARGVLALLNNDAVKYNAISKEIDNNTKVAGATQRAFAEQAKGVVFQFEELINGARATGIELGMHLLPTLIAAVHGMSDLGTQAGPLLTGAFHLLAPLLIALWHAGGNVVAVLGELFHALAPLGGALGLLAGGAAVAGLTTLAQLVESLTRLLADHEHIVAAVGAVYAASLLLRVLGTVRAFAGLVVQTITLNAAMLRQVVVMEGMAAVEAQVAAGALAMAGSLAATLIPLAAIGATVYVAARGFTRLQEAQTAANEAAQQKVDSVDLYDTQALNRQKDALLHTAEAAVTYGNRFRGASGVWRLGWNEMFGDGTAGKVATEGQAAAKAFAELDTKGHSLQANLSSLQHTTGLTSAALEKIAKDQNVDLSKPFTEAADERNKILEYVRSLEATGGVAVATIRRTSQVSLEELKALEEAIGKAQDDAAKAFGKDFDVLGSFKVSTDKKAGSFRAQFTKAYDTTLADARNFTANLQTVIQRGLDPAAVETLIEAGPKQAGPILAGLVQDTSGSMIKMVNKAQTELGRLQGVVVEQARLTALAVNSQSDKLTRELGTASRIAQLEAASNGKATAEQIAKAIGKPTKEVLSIAADFGITLAAAIQTALNQHPPRVPAPVLPPLNAGKIGQLQRAGVATGGPIFGPGGPTDDAAGLYALSNGEWVHRAAAVSYYGQDFMRAINERRIPRSIFGLATGGPVGPAPTGPSTVVIRVPVSETRTYDAPVHIAQAVFTDPAAAAEFSERQRRARGLGPRSRR